MKNIHILPTDKPSRLWINNLLQGKLELSEEALPYNTAQNIYITSDEEIKEGDWFLHTSYGSTSIQKALEVSNHILDNQGMISNKEYNSKIILTTDQDLIGVQAIPEEFLEWFVKNPSCEFVEVEELCGGCGSNDGDCWRSKECNKGYFKNKYKIIISKEEPKFDDAWLSPMQRFKLRENKPNEEEPKQEYDIKESNRLDDIELEKMSNDWETMSQQIKPKQLNPEDFGLPKFGTKEFNDLCYKFMGGKPKQETTLEEAGKKYIETSHYMNKNRMADITFGAKWQQERMYSEEEVLELLYKREDCLGKTSSMFDYQDVKEWFEQFKKK